MGFVFFFGALAGWVGLDRLDGDGGMDFLGVSFSKVRGVTSKVFVTRFPKLVKG